MKPNSVHDFWKKIDIREDDECWEWLAGKDKDGYGLFWWNNRQGRATRYLMSVVCGKIGVETHIIRS